MAVLMLGYGKEEINPPLGTELGGFDTDERKATGIHDNLYTRAIVLDVGGRKACILQNDLLHIPNEFADEIKKEISGLGIGEEDIFVGAIHTHSGPRGLNKTARDADGKGMACLLGNYDEALCAAYLQTMKAAVQQALQNGCPATLHYGFGAVDGVAANRNSPDLPGDNTLFVLEGRRADGKNILLYNFACHPTIMHKENTCISADLPGNVAARLEGGRYAMAMFLNGSCGDISTRFTKTSSTFEEVDRLGGLLTAAIQTLAGSLADLRPNHIAVGKLDYPMAIKRLDPEETARRKLLQYQKDLEKAKEQGEANLRIYESRCEGAFKNLGLSKGFGTFSHLPLQVSALTVANIIFVFIPGELFSALSNPIRNQYGNEVIFCGYFNGYQGYIADTASYDAETYETLSSPYARGQGEKLMAQVAERFLAG